MEAASEPNLRSLPQAGSSTKGGFGYLFIECATGEEMPATLQARMKHELEQELAVAARERAQVMHLRLARLD